MAPILTFDTVYSPKPCQRFLKSLFVCILQPKSRNSAFVIESGGVLSWYLQKFLEVQKNWYGFKLLLFSYKTAKFQINGRNTARAGTSSVSRSSLEKKYFKSFGAPSNPLPVKSFLFQNLVVCMRYHNIFFAILKIYFWSIHMDKNLILAITFGFKLNSNLKTYHIIYSVKLWKNLLKGSANLKLFPKCAYIVTI